MSFKRLLGVACVMTAAGAGAATVVWTGAAGVREDGTYAWLDPNNWGGTLPGESDVAQIQNVEGAPDPMRISLDGETQTIGQLKYQGTGGSDLVKAFVENGRLRLAQGHVYGGNMDGYGVKADLEQLVEGNWQNVNNYGRTLRFLGKIEGEGTIVFDGNVNHNTRLEGASVSVHKIIQRSNTLRILPRTKFWGTTVEVNGGYADGNYNGTSVLINLKDDETLSAEDALVFHDEASLVFAGSGGGLTYQRPIVAVDQRFSLALEGGRCAITINSGTTEENYLTVTNFSRMAGTYMRVDGSGLRMPSLANGESGYLGPWIWNQDRCPMKVVDAEGTQSAASYDRDFTVGFPVDGGSPLALVRLMNDKDCSLASETSFFWLWESSGDDKTIHLGDHTLHVYGPIMFRWGGGQKKFEADGEGKIVFHGDDIIVAAAGGGSVEFRAPIAWDAESSTLPYPNLVLVNGHTQAGDGVIFSGRDEIGRYGNINSSLNAHQLVFDGPSDRSIHGKLQDALRIEQRGSGTLTFEETCSFETRSFGLKVSGGKVVMKYAGFDAMPTVVSNGVFELAEGLSIRPTPQISEGGVFQGFGTCSWGVRDGRFLAGGVIAPGNEERVGTLTMGGLKPEGDFTLVCRVAQESNGMIAVSQNNKLTMPTAEVTGTIRVDDLTAGERRIRPTDEFTIIDYSRGGVDNAATHGVTWCVQTATPKFLDVSAAFVTLDTANKRLLVSGIKSLGRGFKIVVR